MRHENCPTDLTYEDNRIICFLLLGFTENNAPPKCDKYSNLTRLTSAETNQIHKYTYSLRLQKDKVFFKVNPVCIFGRNRRVWGGNYRRTQFMRTERTSYEFTFSLKCSMSDHWVRGIEFIYSKVNQPLIPSCNVLWNINRSHKIELVYVFESLPDLRNVVNIRTSTVES